MDGSRVSDFSIKRILSPQLGRGPPEPAPDGGLRGGPGGFGPEPASPWASALIPFAVPAPFPVPTCLQYRGMCFGDGFCPCRAPHHHHHHHHHHAEVSFCAHFAPAPEGGSDAAHSGYQKARMRTVFTDSQSRELEALFQITDYPATEARVQLARNTGLSEETVRVWFKNRRARRKRQRSGSKVRSPCPSPSATAASSERKNYSSSL